MKKLLISSCCLMMLATSTTVEAVPLPLTSNQANKVVVQTGNGRVEINNGNVSIEGFSGLPNRNERIHISTNGIEQKIDSTSSSVVSSSTISQSTNTINLNAAGLQQPHLIKLEARSPLIGQIVLNGKVIKKISSNTFSLNLAPYLSVGEHRLEIEARPTGNESAVGMVFQAPSHSINHTNGGKFQHTFNLIVR